MALLCWSRDVFSHAGVCVGTLVRPAGGPTSSRSRRLSVEAEVHQAKASPQEQVLPPKAEGNAEDPATCALAAGSRRWILWRDDGAHLWQR